MRLRFSIRHLLWLTVVVAMGLGWWINNNANLRAIKVERDNTTAAELRYYKLIDRIERKKHPRPEISSPH